MKLKQIFPTMPLSIFEAAIEVGGLSDDSRIIQKRDLFFVIPRKHFDIFSVLKGIEPVVCAFVAQDDSRPVLDSLGLKKPVIFVKNIRKEFFRAVERVYPYDEQKVKVIGITGTNGKTTTAFCLYHVLTTLRKPVSLISTIGYYIGGHYQRASHTTPDFLQLRKILNTISSAGGGFVVMEVSSHAIKQERIKNITFSRCVFTNLSRDHLDYHRTLANYFNVKKSFFLQNKNAVAIINGDDRYGEKILKNLCKAISYGCTSVANVRASAIAMTKQGSCFTIREKTKSYPVHISLYGLYNVYNVVAAFATLRSLGFPPKPVCKALRTFKGAEGRLQMVARDVFVDYAHTPDALSKVLAALKDIGYKNIICVFGCGGDRDKGKRPAMGRIASSQAAFSVITSDNSRSEDPFAICKQIASGCRAGKYAIVIDRKQAIEKALRLLQVKSKAKKDQSWCVLVAGKGHENYQIIGKARLPFNDATVIRRLLKQ